MGGSFESLSRTPLSQIVGFVLFCLACRLIAYPFLRRGKRGFWVFVNEAFDSIGYASVCVFLILRPFAVQAFHVPTPSMVETILPEDLILADKFTYRTRDPQFGEIVVFQPPSFVRAADPTLGDADFVKRCVGVPGDIIEVRGGFLYRNGKEINEGYVARLPDWDFKLVWYRGEVWPVVAKEGFINDPTVTPIAARYEAMNLEEMEEMRQLPPIPLPKDWFLMMGDNRPNSNDSRAWGPVHRSAIVGRAVLIWMPVNRWRMLP